MALPPIVTGTLASTTPCVPPSSELVPLVDALGDEPPLPPVFEEPELDESPSTEIPLPPMVIGRVMPSTA